MSQRVMKNFSEEDEVSLRRFIFTNPGSNVSLVYPQHLVAGEELSPLMSAYSRTHTPFQDRVMQFLDKDKPEQTRATLEVLAKLTGPEFRNPDGSLRMSTRQAIFNRQWPLKHGHSSIKEETPIFGHVEEVSDITGKKITGHPLIKPQVKSTRYISFKKALALAEGDEDILALPGNERFVGYISRMNARYLEMSDRLTDLVLRHPDTERVVEFLRRDENLDLEVKSRIMERQDVEEGFVPSETDYMAERAATLAELNPDAVKKDIGKFVLDTSRVYLTAANRTSLGFSADARVMEEVITSLLSSPRKEDVLLGHTLWNESKKVAPVLLGEKSHIGVDQWRVQLESEFREYASEKFGRLPELDNGKDGVRLFHSGNVEVYTDLFNAALTIFPYVDASLNEIIPALSDSDVKEVLSKAHKGRARHDNIHPAISHGGLIFEIVMGYHGYRDMFRHRKGARSTQLLTTRLGFETPEMIKAVGLEKEYLTDMKEASDVYEAAREVNPHTAEKLVPFGANCRALHSWQPDQVAYVGRLRGNAIKGNPSYVRIAHALVDRVREVMPVTASLMREDRRTYPPHLWKKGYAWYDQTQRAKNGD